MKKNDWILFGSMMAISLVLFLIFHSVKTEQGDCVIIRQNGEIYGTYSLNENQVIEVDQGEFHNKICIQDGVAFMEEANCPDGYCMSQNEINGEKETIICLPHKLIVEVTQDDENSDTQIDAIAN